MTTQALEADPSNVIRLSDFRARPPSEAVWSEEPCRQSLPSPSRAGEGAVPVPRGKVRRTTGRAER